MFKLKQRSEDFISIYIYISNYGNKGEESVENNFNAEK